MAAPALAALSCGGLYTGLLDTAKNPVLLLWGKPGTEIAGWNKAYDGGLYGLANAIAIDQAGNVYVAGYGDRLVGTLSGWDWWIKKFNSAGVEQDFNGPAAVTPCGSNVSPCSTNDLDLAYHGGTGVDAVTAIAVDQAGNVYLAGYGSRLVDTSAGEDWWIKKFDSAGVEQDFNGPAAVTPCGSSVSPCSTNTLDLVYEGGTDAAGIVTAVNAIAVDSGGFVYMAGSGYHLVSASSGLDWWIKKFNSAGVEQDFNGPAAITACGSSVSPCSTNTLDLVYHSGGNDAVNAIAVDSTGNLYAAGYGFNLAGMGNQDWWIKKFTSAGIEDTVNWNKIFDSGMYASANAITTDKDGNVYMGGHTSNVVGNYTWRIRKLSGNGVEDTNWDKSFFGGTASSGSEIAATIASIALDARGNVYVAGHGRDLLGADTGHDWWLKKFHAWPYPLFISAPDF
jgi:hypothetical protein